jgi:hypothetical protein
MRLACALLRRDPSDEELRFLEAAQPEAFEQLLGSLVPNPADLQPGRLTAHAPVWRAYLAEEVCDGAGELPHLAYALSLVEEGVRFDFVPVDDAAQAASPRHCRNTRIVNASLTYRFPGEPPASRLSGSEPHAVDFGNQISAEQNSDFVDAELLRCAARGVVREWDPARHGGSTPTAVSSLRIVAKAGGTLRMCVSPMYTNLFIRYRTFAYDRVVDLSAMADESCFMFATDVKSGYWQLLMHPSTQRFAAVRWRGRTLAIEVLAFGFANACYDYIALKRAAYQGPSQWGRLLSSYIDDFWSRERTLALARWRLLGFVLLVSSLGFVLSTSKCILRPARRVRYLGFMVDSEACAFAVPDDKLQAFQHLLVEAEQRLEGGGGVTARALASLIGKAMSMAPAVSFARLFGRAASRALHGHHGWEQELGEPADALAQLRVFHELLCARNGCNSWRPRADAPLEVVGDASEAVFASFLPRRELGPHSQCITPFDEQQLARMRAGLFSSAERELQALLLSLQWLRRAGLLHGRLVQYCTDSQNAFYCVMGMKGTGANLDVVRAVYALLFGSAAELSVVWRPRTDVQQQHADYLTKEGAADSTQWKLNRAVVAQLFSCPVLRPSCRSCDGRYFSLFPCPGARGVSALDHRWADIPPLSPARRALLYANPPFHLVGAVLGKVLRERVDCVVVVPRGARQCAKHSTSTPRLTRRVSP